MQNGYVERLSASFKNRLAQSHADKRAGTTLYSGAEVAIFFLMALSVGVLIFALIVGALNLSWRQSAIIFFILTASALYILGLLDPFFLSLVLIWVALNLMLYFGIIFLFAKIRSLKKQGEKARSCNGNTRLGVDPET